MILLSELSPLPPHHSPCLALVFFSTYVSNQHPFRPSGKDALCPVLRSPSSQHPPVGLGLCPPLLWAPEAMGGVLFICSPPSSSTSLPEHSPACCNTDTGGIAKKACANRGLNKAKQFRQELIQAITEGHLFGGQIRVKANAWAPWNWVCRMCLQGWKTEQPVSDHKLACPGCPWQPSCAGVLAFVNVCGLKIVLLILSERR